MARGHRDEQAAVTLIGALFDRARHPGRVHVGLCRCSSSRTCGDDWYGENHAGDRMRGQADGRVGDHAIDGDRHEHAREARSADARRGRQWDGVEDTAPSPHIDDIVAAYGAAYPHHEGRFDTNVRVLTEEPTSERGAANAMLLVQRHLYRGQRYYATVSVDCRPCHGWDVAALSDLDRAALHQSLSADESALAKVFVTMRLPDDSDDDEEDSTDDDDADLDDDGSDGRQKKYNVDADGTARVLGTAERATSKKHRDGDAYSVAGSHNYGGHSRLADHATGSKHALRDRPARGDKTDRGSGTRWPPLIRDRGRCRDAWSLSAQSETRAARASFGSRGTTKPRPTARSSHHRPPTFAVFEMWSPRGLPVLRTRSFRYAPVRPFGTPFWHSDFSLCDASALVRDAPWDPWYEHLPLDGAADWCTTVRLWTRGWDFYSPTRALVRRAKGRARNACVDSPVDLPRRVRREREAAYARAWALLGLEVPWRPSIEPCYALGTARTLAAFMRQSGLDWLDRRADAHAFVGMLPLGDAGAGVAVRFDEREVAAKYGSWARFLDETDYRGGVAVHW